MAVRSGSVATGFPIGWSNYDAYAGEAANTVGISASWFTQLLHNENGKGDPGATLIGYTSAGHTDAEGLAQFEPGTAKEFQADDGSAFNRLNPFQSIDAAAIYVGDLYQKFLGKGQTSDQAYASAAKAYGDTASNNAHAASFQSKLQKALNVDTSQQVAQAGTQAVSNFGLGLQTAVTDPGLFVHTYANVVAAGAGAFATNPAAATNYLTSNAAAGTTAVAGAAVDQTAKAFAPVIGLATALQSGTIWERVALVVLGIALIIVALTALGAKPLAGVASRLPPIIPV